MKTAAKLINAMAIETPSGVREFRLLHGDITAVESDLLLFSTHAGEGEASGGVVSALEFEYGEGFFEGGRRLLGAGDGDFHATNARHPRKPDFPVPAETHYFSGGKGSPDLLMCRIPAPYFYEDVTNALNGYARCLRCAFASLAVLEFEQKLYRTITMSLLGGARTFPKRKIMEILLRESLRWLETSRHTRTIGLVLYEQGEVEQWSEVMNAVLQRPVIEADAEQTTRILRKQLIEKLGALPCPPGPMEELRRDLHAFLCKPGAVAIQEYGRFGRMLAEVVSSSICHDLGLPAEKNAFANIERIHATKRVAPWINSYLHCLRILGNESVHSADSLQRQPRALESHDLVVLFANLQRVIEFYEIWQSNRTTASDVSA